MNEPKDILNAGFAAVRATVSAGDIPAAERAARTTLAHTLRWFRAQGPTPVGTFVLEATQFVSAPIPTRASANGVKIQ